MIQQQSANTACSPILAGDTRSVYTCSLRIQPLCSLCRVKKWVDVSNGVLGWIRANYVIMCGEVLKQQGVCPGNYATKLSATSVFCGWMRLVSELDISTWD